VLEDVLLHPLHPNLDPLTRSEFGCNLGAEAS
jgi:hypothetical protein